MNVITSAPRLAGKHALVTGSTSGIGAETARALAAEGARVVVTGRDRTRGEVLAKEIGGQAVFVPADLTSAPAQLRAFTEQALGALHGRIDILVNNAAICPATTTPELTDAELDAALAVNVRAPHILVAALAPLMAKRGTGCVVTIGSWMASTGTPFAALYSATKAAEEQLTRSWAAEFGPRGVRFSGVAPGVTRAPGNVVEAIATRMVESTPAGRPVAPRDIAQAVVWLVSDDATFVQGTTIPVDGGISATRPV